MIEVTIPDSEFAHDTWPPPEDARRAVLGDAIPDTGGITMWSYCSLSRVHTFTWYPTD